MIWTRQKEKREKGLPSSIPGKSVVVLYNCGEKEEKGCLRFLFEEGKGNPSLSGLHHQEKRFRFSVQKKKKAQKATERKREGL